MLIRNNSAAPVILNLRDGKAYTVEANGATISLPDSYTALLDDNASTIALFNSGVLTALTDAGAPFPNFPSSVSAADSRAGRTFALNGLYDANGNPTLSGPGAEAVRSVSSSGTIDPTCMFYIPGRQFVSSGNAKDLSGNGADAVIGAGTTDAEVWANAGYITSKATTGAPVGKLGIPQAKSVFDLSNDAVLFAANLNLAAPGANSAFIGPGSAGAGIYGFTVSARTSGKLLFIINTPSGSVATAETAAIYCDSTPHHLLVGFDPITGEVKAYCDGILSNAFAANTFGRSGVANPTQAFALGGATGVSGNAIAAKFSGVQLYKKAGAGLPSNLNLIAARMAAQPNGYLSMGSILW